MNLPKNPKSRVSHFVKWLIIDLILVLIVVKVVFCISLLQNSSSKKDTSVAARAERIYLEQYDFQDISTIGDHPPTITLGTVTKTPEKIFKGGFGFGKVKVSADDYASYGDTAIMGEGVKVGDKVKLTFCQTSRQDGYHRNPLIAEPIEKK